MLTVTKCWPTPIEVPFDDFGNPIPGLELEAWALVHARNCPECHQRDLEVDTLF